MEKYGQYRDKGSGIAPFFPVAPPASSLLLIPWHFFLFCVRLPLVTFAWFVWFAVIQWLPAGSVLRKANLWCVLGIPGVWWIDIQVDGVKRGSLSQTPRSRIPGPGQIIASSHTSPLDVLYLAAIFDPIFTQSHAGTQLVRPVSLETALASCFDIQPPPPFSSQQGAVTLAELTERNKGRVVVVFPEGTTSNGRGILKPSSSLLSAHRSTKIFPVSLRYTPPDIVTPIPGWAEAMRFIWRLNSGPTHCIRVRIGAPLTLSSPPPFSSSSAPDKANPSPAAAAKARHVAAERKVPAARNGFESNFFDTLQTGDPAEKIAGNDDDDDDDEPADEEERGAVDAVADALARLGRVKRVALGVEEKRHFAAVWQKRAPIRK